MVFHINEAQQHCSDQLGAWYMYSGTHRVTEKLSVHSAIQPLIKALRMFFLKIGLKSIDVTVEPR